VLGYLITVSTFAPVALGVLIGLAGLGWLIAVVPGIRTWTAIAVVLFGAVAEGALAIWLLIGVKRLSVRSMCGYIAVVMCPHGRCRDP
jgi:hypothetical protein